MSERGSGKSRKSPASKALATKQPASKAAKKPAGTARKAPASAAGKRKPAAGASTALDAPALQARIVKLEGECARLLSELEKAQGRIRELEEGRDQVLTRIDYVIDSLRSLIEIDQ